jgi:hypothetical protein
MQMATPSKALSFHSSFSEWPSLVLMTGLYCNWLSGLVDLSGRRLRSCEMQRCAAGGALAGVSDDRSAFVCVKVETSRTTRLATRRRISEVRNPLQYRCENLDSRIGLTGYKYQ